MCDGLIFLIKIGVWLVLVVLVLACLFCLGCVRTLRVRLSCFLSFFGSSFFLTFGAKSAYMSECTVQYFYIPGCFLFFLLLSTSLFSPLICTYYSWLFMQRSPARVLLHAWESMYSTYYSGCYSGCQYSGCSSSGCYSGCYSGYRRCTTITLY
ncbi:hypothetical protein BZA05DRAFT_400114 [Tricharina praecox]|uniref:uncharacterized protein n=1 Tax=Tricharina praecox TaxID=43433 RepID=UPI00221F0A4C|nr:uncharacterized protein BZA05DRAFT_400114 [Tricharina praecox]KAI5850730.1 hypothetical protein BZA05DRAFT_400114 [Tricharina praecox]